MSHRKPVTLIHLLRSRALNQPDGLAYVFLSDGQSEESSLTYGELDRKARAVARRLQLADVTGKRVLLLYPPGFQYIITFLGCIYAGAVAVPVYPPRPNRSLLRLQAIAADAQAAVALTTSAILSRLEPLLAQSPLLGSLQWMAIEEIDDGLADDWREPVINAETLAFLQYTSGSTGLPKGVMISHGNILHNSLTLSKAFEYDSNSLVVSWLPVYHDMGLIGGVIQPLYGGYPCVLMAPLAFLQRPFRWLQAISRYKATISGGPNFAYDLCVRKTTPEERSLLDLSAWSVAFNGSEPVRAETLNRFADVFGPCGFRREAFYPCYGLAEATLIVSGGSKGSAPVIKTAQRLALERNHVAEAPLNEKGSQSFVSCGRALHDQKIAIVNPESLAPCQSGQIGEIWVSGQSVARGYWNRAEENRRVFQARIAGADEGPFLRTGDLGFILESRKGESRKGRREDGELFITGRLKDLIIIRGHNHYPQDIELTVERCVEAIQAGRSAAFPVELDGEERLIVALETDHNQWAISFKTIAETIRQAIAEEHEIQAHAILLVRRGAIPKTSSGKLQRYACRRAFLEGSFKPLFEWMASDAPENEAPTPITAPESAEAVESWLVSQIAAKLQVDRSRIDINQPITQYGLDSLMALELAHATETGLGIDLPMTSLLQDMSIAQIASQGMARLKQPPGSSALPAQEAFTQYRLSRGQQALWFLQKLTPESSAYNIAAAARIRSHLNVAALRRAFELVAERHTSLRTTFAAEQGAPIQRIHERAEIDFRQEDASNWNEATLGARLSEETRRPFDLEKGPLLRISLYTKPAEEHVLLLVTHHIVSDFWSLSVLAHEVATLYSAETTNKSPLLPPLRRNYLDYVRWQEDALAGSEGERLWQLWREQLAGELPVLNLPLDHPRPPVQTFRGASWSFELSSELARKLKELSQTRGVTLYTTLLAAFQVLLYRYTGQQDFLIGSPTAGRRRAEFSGVIGYFVNPVVLRADLSGNPTFELLLARTRRAALAAFERQDYPFALLVERLQLVRDPSRTPLFQVMFIFQKPHLPGQENLAAFALGRPGARIQMGELILESVAPDHQAAQFDLTLVMAETDGGLGASLQYNSDLFDLHTIERMAANFQTLLESIAANPDERVSLLPLLPPNESGKLLKEWNETGRDYPRDCCIHQLFEKQVERIPEATAVVFEGARMSFGDLNSRANQVAWRLIELGVVPEAPVGIFMDRSLEMMVGLLGILKSGGAYLPLDPTLPKERLAFMLEDARAQVLLTGQGLLDRLPAIGAKIVCLDSDWSEISKRSSANCVSGVAPENRCYLIYTSGSTGRPKGVMVTHRSVASFFAGMDDRIGSNEGDSLLAVTSISFDISVLELFWTLARGSRVVLLTDRAVSGLSTQAKRPKAGKAIHFSLFYFASADSEAGDDRYRLLLEGARLADRYGLEAVWTPERHFHAFGGLYPNPAVTSAALASVTERVKIRAGSVVMPLHNPIRVAEEWSLVDNLSKGRVGIACASGWHADDFVFFPHNYPDRRELMLRGIETVQRLWRGETIRVAGGAGNEIEVRIFPKPIQAELPIWLTAAGSPDTFVKAGEIGAGVLTHLLGQTVGEVAGKIKLYRESLARNGRDPQAGRVTLMLHTFIERDKNEIRNKVRLPFTNYLRTSVGLIANMIRSLDLPLDLGRMSQKDMDDLLDFAFDRYFETSALFGTPDTCESMIEQLQEIGVDEVACLIDFGVDVDAVLASLGYLNELKERLIKQAPGQSPGPAFEPAFEEDYSLPAQALRHGASLMQCTPSMMKMLALSQDSLASLGALRALMLGGEALPANLAREVKETLPARLINMYGPTETTIWSATHEVAQVGGAVSIGRPIANTRIYILDRHLQPVPIGVTGGIYIGGEGLARGYANRPDLTAEKFTPDPFGSEPGARMYDTGDLGRHLPDGTMEFLGRSDHQIKIRGHRIELEEIEAALGRHPAIREAVVAAIDDAGEKKLAAYIVSKNDLAPGHDELRGFLKDRLPDYMLPSAFVTLKALPLTPNGKVDRKALPAPDTARPDLKAGYEAPRNKLESAVAEVWQRVLNVDRVGMHDNFFDLGGHSLLMAQAHSQLTEVLKKDLPLIKLLEYPTISSLAKYLAGEESGQLSIKQNYGRARKQKEALERQRESLKAKLKF